MSLNVDKLMDDMASAMKDAAGAEGGEIKDTMKKILERRKDRLQMLLDVVEDQLDQQKKVLESELLEVQLKSKVAAGKAANAAMNVLLNAVRASIT